MRSAFPRNRFSIACHERVGALALARVGDMLMPAICRELPPSAEAPDWIEILPSRGEVVGLDGRRFNNANPELLVERFNAQTRKPMVDWEHFSEKSWSDVHAPAAGWGTDLEVRDGGSVWMRVDWTPGGAASVKNRDYRYVSPAFFHDKEGVVLAISSVGLTNRPNLTMTALNAAETHGVELMDPEILKALGLPPDATPAAVAVAINKMKAAQTAAPNLEYFVPRADYDLAVNQVKTLEEQARATALQTHGAAVDAAINAATQAGKITPATVEFYRSTCATAEGLETFRKFVDAAPVVATNGAGFPEVPAGGSVALSQDELAVCKQLGLTKEEYLAERNASN